MPLTNKNFSRAWQGHFLSQALQTWQICFFFVDVQMILLPYLDTSDCLEIEKNEKAFLSRYSELFDLHYAKSQYAKQESNEVERYSETKITAPFYDP